MLLGRRRAANPGTHWHRDPRWSARSVPLDRRPGDDGVRLGTDRGRGFRAGLCRHATIAGHSDLIIATRGSAVGMGGPPLRGAGARHKGDAPRNWARSRCTRSPGGIDLLVADEQAAIAAAKQYLRFFLRGEANVEQPPTAQLDPPRSFRRTAAGPTTCVRSYTPWWTTKASSSCARIGRRRLSRRSPGWAARPSGCWQISRCQPGRRHRRQRLR